MAAWVAHACFQVICWFRKCCFESYLRLKSSGSISPANGHHSTSLIVNSKPLTLFQQVEAELQLHTGTLSFAPDIEARYEAETAQARNRQIYTAGIVALLVFNAFLFNDYKIRTEIFYLAVLIRLLLVTLPCFVIVSLIQRGVSPLMREILTASGCLIVTGGASLINWHTRGEAATYSGFSFVLILISCNIALPMRFKTALIASILSAFIMAIGVFGHPFIPAIAQNSSMLIYVLCGVMTLLANYRLELAERKSFLNYLRENLRNEAMQETNLALQRMSNCDPLTGLSNRRRFDDAFLSATGGHPARPDTLALLMIDIDHFKPYNDSFGHPAGDKCLQTVASLIKEQVRGDKDVVARIGGEEFAVLLLGAGIQEAVHVAERVREHWCGTDANQRCDQCKHLDAQSR
ncbi:MAG: diguanylate cyclase [Comamonadaceae bacterium]|nr:MAG: diguanylate cyclase [Comamonadaceae bacterium]